MTPTEDFRIDGVPVFVGPEAEDDPSRAFVMIYFRVGTSDEVLAYSGITRLAHNMVEASIPVELQEYVSSSSSGLFTQFRLYAPIERIDECVRALAYAIRYPNWDVFDRQKQFLAADPITGSYYPESMLLNRRYGTKGAGTNGLDKLAFSTATQAMTERWLRTRFCRNDASIVIGENASITSFDIPEGGTHDLVLSESVAKSTPAFIESLDDNFVAFQLGAPWGEPGQLAMELLIDLIDRRITLLGSLAPHTSFSVALIDSTMRMVTISVPLPAENAAAVVVAVRETIEDAADGLFGAGVFESARDKALEDARSRISNGAATSVRAMAKIFPAIGTVEDAIDSLEAMSAADVAATIKESAKTLIVLAPRTAAPYEGLTPFEYIQRPAVEGDRQKMGGIVRLFKRDAFVCTSEGIRSITKNDDVTVRFADCTAMFDTGVSLRLIAQNGDSVMTFPALYRKGDEIAATIRGNVSENLTVHSEPNDNELELHESAVDALKTYSGVRGVLVAIVVIYVLANIVWNAIRFAPYFTHPTWVAEGFLFSIIVILIASKFAFVRRVFIRYMHAIRWR